MLIAVGFIFLVNPCIHIIDVLPDFIGFILMAFGVDKLADIEGRFAAAKKGFIELAVISAVKTAGLVLLPHIDEIFVILLVFSFGLLEAMFFIPAMKNLFEGFRYFGLRCGSNNVSAKSEGVQAIACVAYCFRIILAFLPEVPKLFVNSTSGIIGGTGSVDWTDFTLIYYAMASIVVLAVGIPAAVKMWRYLRKVSRDEIFCKYTVEKIETSVLGDEAFAAQKQIRAVNVMVTLGAIFLINVYFDYVNWMPCAVSAIFFAISAAILRRNSKFAYPCILSAVLWAVPSVMSLVKQIEYASFNYKPEHFRFALGKTEYLYPTIMKLSIADAVLMALTLVFFALCIKDTLKAHTKVFENNLPDVRAGRAPIFCRELVRKFIPAFVLYMVLCALYIVYPIACVYYPEIWLLNLAISIAALACLIRALTYTIEELYDKLIGNY